MFKTFLESSPNRKSQLHMIHESDEINSEMNNVLAKKLKELDTVQVSISEEIEKINLKSLEKVNSAK